MSNFYINTNIYWGSQRYNQIFEFLKNESIKRVLFFIDNSLVESPGVKLIVDEFIKNRIQIVDIKYIKLLGEPTYEFLDEQSKVFRGLKVDLNIAIGGGSLIDLVKGISILMNNPKNGIHYRGFNKVKKPGIPLCAFPSTAGTGSEVTWTASFVDNAEGKKLGINGKYVAPICGLLEPKLLLTCPANVMVSSGLDALVHSVEAITAKTQTVITNYLGIKAFKLTFENLPKSLKNPQNLELKEKLLIGSYLAGIAMMNAGGGPASGVSYPIGVHYKVPHGIAGGIFLHEVFKQNIDKGYQGYLPLAKALFNSNKKLKEDDLNNHFLENFKEFYLKVNGPKNLIEWGIDSIEKINHIVELTMEQRVENLNLNPVPYGKTDLQQLLEITLLKSN